MRRSGLANAWLDVSTSSFFLVAGLVASTLAYVDVAPPVPAAAPVKLAASQVTQEVAAVRTDAKTLQAGVAALVARKGADPAKAAAALGVSVAKLRSDVARFKTATKNAPTEVKLTLGTLDKQLLAFSKVLDGIETGQPLSKGDADDASASAKRVMDGIDALFGLIEPVVHR